MKPLVKITENIVKKRLSRLGAIQTHILLNWNYIAEEYAKITIPDKIKFNRNKSTDGQMMIKVQNGFGPEIQHATPFLLNQINSRFGYKAITKIKIIQTELPYTKQSKKNVYQQEVVTKNLDLISDVLPDGELKLAMQRFEVSRKKMLS
tara:strand:- start:49 stop:495 length:447 start_codon:yes stop_codon:yes gene_type:complete